MDAEEIQSKTQLIQEKGSIDQSNKYEFYFFYDQISLFVLFNTFLWVENAYFIFNIYFRSLKFELKSYLTRER
jgi:hypothetical protein